MEQKPKKKRILKRIKNIYISIKDNSLNLPVILTLSNLVEMTTLIVIIDIIGNYRRTWVNFHSYLYWLSSGFLNEFFFVIVGINQPYSIPLAKETFKTDQILLFISSIFSFDLKIAIHTIYSVIALGACLIIIAIIFVLLSIKSKLVIFRYIKVISAFILYIIFKTLFAAFFLLFNYQLFTQFSSYAAPVNVLLVFQLILAIIFDCFAFLFNNFFIYGYCSNTLAYFVNENKYKTEFALQVFGGINMILRTHPTESLIFKVLWLICFIYYFYLMTYEFIYDIHMSNVTKANYFFIVVIMSMMLTRILTIFLINGTGDVLLFQVLEVLIEIFASILIYFFVSSFQTVITVSEIDDYLNAKGNLFFIGLQQLFAPLEDIYSIQSSDNKVIEKQKEVIVNQYKKDLIEVYCTSQRDFDLIDMKDIRISMKTHRSTVTNNTPEKEYVILLKVLIQLLKQFIKKVKSRNNSFSTKARQFLVYKKVLMYFIFDLKAIRSEFFLTKFIYSKSFRSLGLLGQSVFKGLKVHFVSVKRKTDDHSLSYLIHFLKLNEEYLSIINAMNLILKNYSQGKTDLIKAIDTQSKVIGNSFDNIISLTDKTNDSIKIKEQPEREKFKLIEDLMFNCNIDRSFEKFDLPSLDMIVEKNDYFILYYFKNDFFIKKAPLAYTQVAGFKSRKIVNKPFASIFPLITSKAQMSFIKKKMFSKKSFSMESVLETNTHYLTTVKLVFNLLPMINGTIYLICSLDPSESQINKSNYVLMQRNGNSKLFGLYFNHYFTISNTIAKTINFLSLFNIQDFNPDKAQTLNCTINIELFLQEMKKILFKDSVYQKKEIEELTKKVKDRFNSTTTSLELIIKDTYITNQAEYYLVQFIFADIKSSVICTKKSTRIDTTVDRYRGDNNTLSMTRSGSSVASFRLHKENNWNISTERKEQTKLSKNLLDRISFFYNVLLILFAIAILVASQELANNFYIDFVRLITLRQTNTEYYYTHMYMSASIMIEGSEGIHDSLNEKYKIILPDYTIDIKDYFKKQYQAFAVSLIELTHSNSANFSDLHPKTTLYDFMQKETTFLKSDGSIANETYLNQFNIPKNYFYILSKRESYYLEIPIVSFHTINEEIKALNEEQQYAVSLMYNSFSFFTHLKDIIYYSKQNFKESFDNYKLWIMIFFFGFLLLNVLSLVLVYLSINNSNRKISLISEKLILINKKHVEFLKEKVKIIKQVISNEMKPSTALAQVKEKVAVMKGIALGASSSTNLSNEDPNSSSAFIEREENSSLIRKMNKRKEAIWFEAYEKVIKVFSLLAMIYALFSIITFPILWSYINTIEALRTITDTIDDIQGLLVMYYLDIKYAIYFNNTEKLKEIKLFDGFTEYIYANYTFLNKKLFLKSSSYYLDYIDLINQSPDCKSLLPDDEFAQSINAICLEEPQLHSNIETMISYFVSKGRNIYNTFVLNKRTVDDIRNAYHHEEFQMGCLIESIYFITVFKELKFNYLLIAFDEKIRLLSMFLIIIFVLLLVIEIINYYLSTVFILRVLSSSLNNFSIIDKFFTVEKVIQK